MKKLLLVIGLILSCQILTSQMNYEFSTWLKTQPVDEYIIEYTIEYSSPVNYYQGNTNNAWKILAVASLATITEAIGDGLYDEGKVTGNQSQMRLGKLLQAGSIGIRYFYIPIYKKSHSHWLWIPVIEIGMRTFMFDPTYNITRGIRATKIGNTSYWDQALNWTNQPEWMLFFGRTMVGFATITLTFDKF